ncbi:unnamed protein product, partial [Mesorhabditis spiculigera]
MRRFAVVCFLFLALVAVTVARPLAEIRMASKMDPSSHHQNSAKYDDHLLFGTRFSLDRLRNAPVQYAASVTVRNTPKKFLQHRLDAADISDFRGVIEHTTTRKDTRFVHGKPEGTRKELIHKTVKSKNHN